MTLVPRVLAAAAALEKAGQQIFQPHGLTSAQFNLLHLLSAAPEGRRASDLAASLVVDPSNVTGLLNRAQRSGLIRAAKGSGDRRERMVILSPKGRAAWRRAEENYRKRIDGFEARVTPGERTVVERVLQRLEAECRATK